MECTRPNYQLTKHPIGSVREVWSLSWPLMLGLMSASLMIFFDRLLLSWYSPMALNAGANAGMAYYLFLVIPMSICDISEVLVGRLNGEKRIDDIGKPVWQMIWFALLLAPLFWAIALFLPPILFYKTGNEAHETVYFQTLMAFAPFLCANIALCGFFVGTGRVKIVTYSMILANIANVIVGYVLIFGWGPFPSLGIAGAGIATGIAEIFHLAILLSYFLKKEFREKYGTNILRYESSFFKEGLRIGAPAGSGHAIEVLAHYAFFRIVMMSGSEHMTIVAFVQSFYILVSFLIEAESKGVSAIVANLLGARELGHVTKVFKSAIKLHTSFFLIIGCLLLMFPDLLTHLFFSGQGAAILQDPSFRQMTSRAIIWITIFFLFDGFSWILAGHLTAAGDTKFIFYVSSVVNWIAYVFPAFLLVSIGKNGADVALLIMAVYSMLNFCIYYWRFRSGKWLHAYVPQKEDEMAIAAS